MKKIIFAIATILVCSCSGNKESKSETSEVNVEETLTRNSEDEAVESVEDEPEMLSSFRISTEGEYGYYKFKAVVTCHDDGTAEMELWTKKIATREEDQTEDTSKGVGSWKSMQVKRGTKYLNAYDVEFNEDMSLYFTEKFDLLFGLFDDNAYYNFYEGKTGHAWKIMSVEKL